MLTPAEKIRWVKEQIQELSLIRGNFLTFPYFNVAANTKIRPPVAPVEQYTILSQLADRKFLEIVDNPHNPDGLTLRYLPPRKPVIRRRALEYIAKAIAELDEVESLARFLMDCDVPQDLIRSLNDPWLMLYLAFEELATSHNSDDRTRLLTVMEESARPAMHQGDINKAKVFTARLNQLLKHEGFRIIDGQLLEEELIDVEGNEYPVFFDKKGDIYNQSEKQPSEVSNLSLPIFDNGTGIMSQGSRTCEIPIQTNQYFLCSLVFSRPCGERIKEIEVLDLADWAKDSPRSVYDATRAVNKKIKDQLGLSDFLVWSKNRVFINPKYCDS